MKEHLIYLREHSHPVACVAVVNNGESSAYQLSSLNPKDHFNKKLAREMATGRLHKKPIPLALKTDVDFWEMMRGVLEAIVANPDSPPRARQAASMYLTVGARNAGVGIANG